LSCEASIVLISEINCAREPCVNNGTCQEDGNGGYNCTCPPPYRGQNCEIGTSLIILHNIWRSHNDHHHHCHHYRRPTCRRTIGPEAAASEHTTVPINHTRPSPRKHSPDGATRADIRLQLATYLSTPKG